MEKNNQNVQKEFTFVDLWNIFLNNVWFIILSTIFCGILLSIYVWFLVTPNYISNADVMVQVEQDSNNNNSNFDLVNAFRLIDTVAELMEKEVILNNLQDRLENLGYTNLDVKYLRDALEIKSSSTSYFINISFIDADTLLAKDAVDELINAVIEETDIADAFPVLTNKIRRTSYASESIYYSPNKIFFSFLGVVIGFVFGSSVIYFKEVLSSNFKSKDHVESVLDLQVIGLIPYKEMKDTNIEKK